MISVQNVVLVGMSTCLPKQVVSNYDAFPDAGKVIKSTGVESRHICSDTVLSSDLCLQAAQHLLREKGWEPTSLDALVFVSQTPDYQLPATSCVLQHKLGMRTDTLCFDISLGCSGYVHGLQVAASLVSNGHKRVLLLVGDTITKLVDPQDQGTAVLFGDAGSATLLEYSAQATPLNFVSGTDGGSFDAIIVPPSTVKSLESGRGLVSGQLEMDGASVFTFTLNRVPEIVQSLMQQSKKSVADYNLFVFHQANAFMLKHLAKKIKIPMDKFVIELEQLGNTSCASIPTAICQRSIHTNVNQAATMFVGFGVGLSWGAAEADLTSTLILAPIEYKEVTP